jgi:subtilase family serine protease
MIRKTIVSLLVLSSVVGGSLAATGSAEARYWGWGWGAGGVAAGLVGGALIGSAIASQPRYYDDGPVYYDEGPAYPQHCHMQNERVHDAYDAGSHIERVRVCQ